MKILIYIGRITIRQNPNFMQFYVIIPDIPTFTQQGLTEIIGDLQIVSNNNKCLAKFHSGTLRIIDTMRIMPLSKIIARTPIGILLEKAD